MFRKKNDNVIDYGNINETVTLLKKILKIAYVLILIVGIYAITMICKEWHVKRTILMVLATISPLFIGFFLAWLFEPIVTWFESKKFSRFTGALITYILFVAIIFIILGSIFPVLSDQINDFVRIIPSVFDKLKGWIDQFLMKFNSGDFDVTNFENSLFTSIEKIGGGLTNTLPETIVSVVKSLVSGIGSIAIGVIIGFYLSISFRNASDSIITLLPKKVRNSARELANEINTTCRNFVKGALIDSSVIFVVSSIVFSICGLKAPLLFGLFCGITNVIPYAGPYIGGIPAVIVAFSQSMTTGIAVLIAIVIIQAIEGNFLQALIMSKSTKLHPVTIIIGLLVFGYFFGIIGMVISTPIIGTAKVIFNFFNEKYHLIGYDD